MDGPGIAHESGVEHVVPLPPRAVEILQALPRKGEHVFVNGNDQPISNMAMLALMKGMGVDATPHGMRSRVQHLGKKLHQLRAGNPQRGLGSYGGEIRQLTLETKTGSCSTSAAHS